MRSIDKKCQGEAKIGNTDKRCHKISPEKGLTEPKRLGYTLLHGHQDRTKNRRSFWPLHPRRIKEFRGSRTAESYLYSTEAKGAKILSCNRVREWGSSVSCDCIPGSFLCKEAERLWGEVIRKMRVYDDYSMQKEAYDTHINLAAKSSLGRLGGLAKSEAKTQSSRENGKKGGRPRKVREERTIEESNLDLFT